MKDLFVGWAMYASFALMAMQPVMAYEDGLWAPQVKGKTSAGQQGEQKGEAPKPWENRPWAKPSASKPWEARPWDSATEELRPEGARQGEELKPDNDRRRVGRKARKEREQLGKSSDDIADGSASPSRLKQYQDKWRKHQMENELYYPAGMRR